MQGNQEVLVYYCAMCRKEVGVDVRSPAPPYVIGPCSNCNYHLLLKKGAK